MDEHEITEICREYGFERQALARFLTDYFVIPHEELPPRPDDPVDHALEEIARQIGLPGYVLHMAQKAGAIGDPLTSGDLDALRCVRKLFGRSWFVRAQLVKSNKAERLSLLQRPELLPWERWAYNQFLSHKIEISNGDRSASDQRLYLSSLLRTLFEAFKVPPSDITKDRLLQIRKMATNDFYASRQRGIEVGEMAKRRGVELEQE